MRGIIMILLTAESTLLLEDITAGNKASLLLEIIAGQLSFQRVSCPLQSQLEELLLFSLNQWSPLS